MTTFGFEVEFIIPDEQVPIYKKFIKEFYSRDASLREMIISTDCGHLVEGKTRYLSFDEFNWFMLDRLRKNMIRIIEDIGLSYTYYGTHFSAWNFCKKDLVKCEDLHKFDQYAVVLFQNHISDIYIDPFVNGRYKNHAIIMVPRHMVPQDLMNRKVDYGSYQAMLNIVSDESIKELLSWRPVPGGSIRISKHSRLEMVLGWLPRETEEYMIEKIKEAIMPEKRSPIFLGGYVPIFSPKQKYGFSYLSGVTYSEEDFLALRLPSIDPDLVGDFIPIFDTL